MQNKNKKIIIVDDNAANLAVGRNLLKPFYEVFPVPSAAKLFDILEKFIPDLILLDVNMPEMSGYEAIKILKDDPRYSDIPVIFLTAKSDEESEMEGFDLGAADYVAKPFSGPLLLRRIASQLLLEQQKLDLIESREALQDYADNLEIKVREKTAAKTIFLANMSHELRTPMNSIVGFSELALDDDISQKTRGYLTEILESSEWLLHIINDILDITSIESGKIELNNVAFDLYDVIDDCKTMFMPRANENGLMLNFYSDPSVKSPLTGDPVRLRQVLINLLSNAVKFTNVGVVEFQMDVKKLSSESATVFFEVSDSGIGMTAEQISIIFDPFIQAESGNTRRFGGTGLGLTITKNIIEMMGGKINVESEPGVGSKFSFEVTFDVAPVDDDDSDNTTPFRGITRPIFDGEILLCEDNALNQQVACEHLAKLGLRVVVAENGKVGADMVRNRIKSATKSGSGKKPFDLILMDIHMPVMDGIDATIKILEMDENLPIVAMTANIMPDDVELYKKTGMRECIGKPFTSHDLWRCLTTYLEPVDWKEEDEAANEKSNNELHDKLIVKFVDKNQGIINDIASAINTGDIQLAYLIAHTLKGNAGQLQKTPLQQAAEEVERCLKGGENRTTPEQFKTLENELNIVLKEFKARIDELSAPVQEKEMLDKASAIKLMDELEPLLEESNTDCMSYIDKLQRIPGSEKLIKQIEDFDFIPALESLAELKKTHGE